MAWRLIRSGRLVTRSDEPSEFISVRPTQTSSPVGARATACRVHLARHTGRDFPALRATELSLRQRAGTWPQALLVYQPARRAPAKRLRAEWRASSGCRANRSHSQTAQHARRDLRHQRGIAPATRGARVTHHGSGTRRIRYCQGGRHSCRYGHFVPRRWCLAPRSRGAARWP